MPSISSFPTPFLLLTLPLPLISAAVQVKAVIRGEPPPFSAADLDALMSMLGARQRDVRKAEMSTVRYWVLEYLRRAPRDTVYTALVLKWLRPDNSLALIQLLEVSTALNTFFDPSVVVCRRWPAEDA